MISRRQRTLGSGASNRGLRRRTRRVSNNGCFVPLVTRLAAKHKLHIIPPRRIPLSSIPTNKAALPFSQQTTLAFDRSIAPTPTCSAIPHVCDEFVREKLVLFRESMYTGLRHVRYANQPQRSSILPAELQIIMDDHIDAVPPTLMLAVHAAQTTPPGVKRSVTLYPAHSIVLSAHCANLPKLPEPVSESTIPVVPLALPSPQMYPFLQTYLYTKDISMLENALLPSSLPLDGSTLMRQHFATRGLWANARALGVVDAPLYEMIGRVWSRIQQSVAVLQSSTCTST